MEILKNISVMWSMLHTLIIFLFLFESRYTRKKTVYITLATAVPLLIINLVLFITLGVDAYGTLMLLTLSLPSCVLFWFLSKYRGGRFFFTFCMVDTTVLEIVYITNILNHYLTPDTYLVMFFVRLISYPLIELFVYFKLRPIYIDVQKHTKKGWTLFTILSILLYVVITLLMTFPDNIVHRPSQLPALILMFILLPAIYIHIITTFRRQQLFYEISQQENIMKLQISHVASRVEEYSEANERFREERHNFRHKLAAIAALIESKQYDELAKVSKEYAEDIEKTQIKRYCQSPVIDAILSVYLQKAERQQIKILTHFDFPDTFFASEIELATAFGNAIENAIDACIKLPIKDRFIEIKVICVPNFIVMIKNSFNGVIEFDENGIPLSSKCDHGFGTRSIAAFCKKIGGYCEFKATDNTFTVYLNLR